MKYSNQYKHVSFIFLLLFATIRVCELAHAESPLGEDADLSQVIKTGSYEDQFKYCRAEQRLAIDRFIFEQSKEKISAYLKAGYKISEIKFDLDKRRNWLNSGKTIRLLSIFTLVKGRHTAAPQICDSSVLPEENENPCEVSKFKYWFCSYW